MIKSSRVEGVERIAETIARRHAAEVDRDARFPIETLDALRGERVLAAGIAADLGGWGASLSEQAALCTALGRHCASSGMTLAMHLIQVAVLAAEAERSEPIAEYLRGAARDQRLIGSATSEVGCSGMRSSACAVNRDGGSIGIDKRCGAVSYAATADDILLQARIGPDASPSDQCMVLAVRGTWSFEPRGSWDTLGMRGTCSPGGDLKVGGEAWQVLDTPFATIMGRSMVPVSHLLWSAAWLGIALDAEAKASASLRAASRAAPGRTPAAAGAFARVSADVQSMRGVINDALREYEAVQDPAELDGVDSLLRYNNLKLLTSELVVTVVQGALRVCGINAYRNDSEASLGRQLRDAHSAALMLNNHGIRAGNEALHLVHKVR